MSMLSILLGKPVSSPDSVIKRRWSVTRPCVSGLEIIASSVYNICPGTVLAVGKDSDSSFTVSVYINGDQVIRYCNLSSVAVSPNDYVDFTSYIGTANRFVRLEYCSRSKGDSPWVFRDNQLTLYKHDPYGLITGELKLNWIYDSGDTDTHTDYIDGELTPIPDIKFTESELAEWEGSRGDD